MGTKEELHKRPKRALIFLMLVGLLALFLVILKPIFSPHDEMSEEVVVKVIHKTTKKPLQNIDVKISHIVAELTPGGGSYQTIISKDAKTDSNGIFRVAPIAKPRPVNFLIYEKKYWGTFYTLSKGGKVLSHEHVPAGAGSNITLELADSAE